MEITFKANTIEFSKEFNNIDKFVVKFIPLLENIKYVIISGYVALLFGRNRTTEDIDIFIETSIPLVLNERSQGGRAQEAVKDWHYANYNSCVWHQPNTTKSPGSFEAD